MFKDTVIVTCSIIDFTEGVEFLDILSNNGNYLEDFEPEVKAIILNTCVSMLLKTSMKIDVLQYAQENNINYHPLNFEHEIRNLIDNIIYRIRQVSIQGMRLVDIKLTKNSLMYLVWKS